MIVKKFYVIFSETKRAYWNRVTKNLKNINNATQYEGGNIQNIEQIIMTDPDLNKRKDYYSIKTIFKINDDD